MNKILGVYVVNSFIIGETANDLEKNLAKVAQNIKKEIDTDVAAINTDLSNYQKKEQAKDQIKVWTHDKWKSNATKSSFGHRIILANMLDAEDNADHDGIYEYCKPSSKFRVIRLTNDRFFAGHDDEIANRMGNFTLLEKALDWDENWDVAIKSKVLKRSDIIANNNLSLKIEDWNADQVIRRNEHFSELTPILW